MCLLVDLDQEPGTRLQTSFTDVILQELTDKTNQSEGTRESTAGGAHLDLLDHALAEGPGDGQRPDRRSA